jgi:hypothetical protein
MTRTLVAVAIAVLVVLAGCSAGPPTSTTEPGDATADEPTTESTSNDLQRVTIPSELVPPGATQRALVNPQRVGRAHARGLSNVSHQVQTSYTNLGQGSGTVVYELSRDSSGFASMRTVRGGGAGAENESVYFDGDAVRVRSDTGNETNYQYAVGPTRTRLQYGQPQRPVGQVFGFYAGVSGRLVATDFATMNGEKVTRFEAVSANESRFRQVRSALGVPNATLESVHVVAYVDADGVIHDFEAELTVETGDGGTRTFQATHELSAVGETEVRAPSWVASVPTLNGTILEEGRLVEIQNVGNASLGNHTIGVAGNVTADAIVNRTFDPGESAYLYATTNGNETTLHVTETRPDLPADAATLTQRTQVNVYVGTPTVSISLGLFQRPENASVRAPRTTPGSAVATDASISLGTSLGSASLGRGDGVDVARSTGAIR